MQINSNTVTPSLSSPGFFPASRASEDRKSFHQISKLDLCQLHTSFPSTKKAISARLILQLSWSDLSQILTELFS
jgi:hypothetical protein